MSTFVVPIKRIRAIEPHANADSIEFAVIDGYRSIVKKGEFEVDALIAYIPEASLLPEWLLKRMGFWDETKRCGKLNGSAGNRVKAVKLRGELSQGVCLPIQKIELSGETRWLLECERDGIIVRTPVAEDYDVTELLGITKYEPPVPVALDGEVFNAGQHLTIDFDVENWKSYPDILQNDEEVVFTEKLHGTFTGVAVLPIKDAHPEAFGIDKNILIFSKGLGAKGLVFKNNKRNSNNVYVRATSSMIEAITAKAWQNDEPIILMGETFGPGVQDLAYGKDIGFRLFAAAVGYRGSQRYKAFDWLVITSTELGVGIVPVLYRGPFSEAAMREHTDGATTMDAKNIREGIVMVPAKERVNPRIGRVCLKSVSADYLTRKGGTEYN